MTAVVSPRNTNARILVVAVVLREITNNIRLSDCVDESEVKQTEQLRLYDLTDIWVSLEGMNEVGK